MMNLFDDPEKVNEYIKMSEAYNGRSLIEKLKEYLPHGSSLLEIGMGPGKDLDILSEVYHATGSDRSKLFVNRYNAMHPNSQAVLLNAVDLNIDRTFQGIYSNKVLIHLSKNELEQSFQSQLNILESGGIAFHSFWRGDKEESFDGLRFVYYTIETIAPLIPPKFKLIYHYNYNEDSDNDSFAIILKKI